MITVMIEADDPEEPSEEVESSESEPEVIEPALPSWGGMDGEIGGGLGGDFERLPLGF